MKKALIIFGSTTGNTEDMADTIYKILNEADINTEIKNVIDAVPEDLIADYDVLLLGCPAYGDDSIELQEDFGEYYEQLDDIKLNEKKYAVFAPGDSSYEYFCGSVDMIGDKIEELGGELVVDGLKIDGDPADSKYEIAQWVKSICDEINS
ncbi:MAG: flavodoxin [Desulfobacteraceae bacterium]|jgi:flavodoxin short chain